MSVTVWCTTSPAHRSDRHRDRLCHHRPTNPPDCDDAVATLVNAGILTPDAGWSRRRVLAAGGAAAGIGLVTLTLPTAAMAASVTVAAPTCEFYVVAITTGATSPPSTIVTATPNTRGTIWTSRTSAPDDNWNDVTSGDPSGGPLQGADKPAGQPNL